MAIHPSIWQGEGKFGRDVGTLLQVASNSKARPEVALAAGAMVVFLEDTLLATTVLPSVKVSWLDPPKENISQVPFLPMHVLREPACLE